jgi:hypothetical protein
MEAYNDYQRTAYDAARLELNELLTEQERLQKRIVSVRQFIQSVASLFETQGIDLNASIEAAELLRNSTLADEIRIILRSAYPGWLRPGVVKNDLIRLGHNLKKYKNPQATIQMVLKRMAESNDVQESALPEDGKKVYRCVPQVPSLSDPENPLYKSGMRPFPAGAVTNALGLGQSELRDDEKKVYHCVPQVPILSDPENPLYKSGMRPSPAPSGIGAVSNALGLGQPDELPEVPKEHGAPNSLANTLPRPPRL